MQGFFHAVLQRRKGGKKLVSASCRSVESKKAEMKRKGLVDDNNKIRDIGVAQLNPYVRYVDRLEGSVHENHIVPWRVLYDFEMIFVTKGSLRVLKDESEYVIGEGCLHIMPPFVRHTRIVPEGETTTYYGVHFDFMFDESSPDFSANEVYKQPCERKLNAVPIRPDLAARKNYKPAIMELVESYPVKNAYRFVELFNKLYETFQDKSVNGLFHTKAYMFLIIAEFLDDLKSSERAASNGIDYVAQFIDYTMHHYSEEIDLNEVVREYGISPSRFRAIFKHRMNRAPLEYIIDYRIEQAKKLFALHQYNISEVGYMVGYDDMHYFSRLFKQKVGCSPSDYLKEYKKKI